MADKSFLALDLGASNGRAMLGRLAGDQLTLEEVHRFPNRPALMAGHWYWDLPGLLNEIKTGIAQGLEHTKGTLVSAAIDTWGVDFGLITARGKLISNPYHYRDARTEGMPEVLFAKVPRRELFQQTGIQIMPLNSIFQLQAYALQEPEVLELADTLLLMPDLFGYLLTGVKRAEKTIASTTQMYLPGGEWAVELLARLELPTDILPPLIDAGSVLGPLLPEVREEVQAPDSFNMVATGSHDTASAVAAVPFEDQESVYISSGTWSLIGVELDAPLINDKTFTYNFTNETGVGGTIRLLKNVMGLWLLQECRRAWQREGRDYSWDELQQMAASAPGFQAVVNPDAPDFLGVGDMPRTLRRYCQRTGQQLPEDIGGICRCILDSLALRYRWVIERLDEIMGFEHQRIHVVGGGSQNELLCQLTADACGREVVAGPVEATAIGNIVVQAISSGQLAGVKQARELIARSFERTVYQPRPGAAAQSAEAYSKLLQLIEEEG